MKHRTLIKLLGGVAIAWALAVSVAGGARAAEVTVLASTATKTALDALAPQFETATGHKLMITYGASGRLQPEIEKGAPFDLAILSTMVTDALVKQGRLVAATRVDIARSGAGVAVRKGAPKPDISTVEAFKAALLNAKSVAYVEQGGTGIYLKALLPRLGIADALKDRIKRLPPENPAAFAVANGEAEIGMTQISEILPYAGAELVGPLPKEIQLTTSFAVAIGAGARQSEAAQALIRFLTAPAAAPVFKAKGLDPAG
jgi:molybdate transport system substrate-binding protein